MVTDAQVRLLRQKLMMEKTQETAAATADMSVRSARKWKTGPLPSQRKKEREWRTRPDAFAAVWSSLIVPLLVADTKGVLEAKTLLELLEEKQPGEFDAGQVRTLQRRMRDWRAVHGPQKPVFFEQKHTAGREASIDFTHCEELGVTIAGQPFAHLLFEFVLSFSKWLWVGVAFAETFEALVGGIQGALWDLGGVPLVLRSDNLSAATHQLPSRLIGHDIVARLYPDTVEVYYHDERVLTMPRLHGEHEHRIDYRHVIWSLVKKPGAFARYRYREDLFPSLIFRRAYDSLLSRRGDRAEVEYVRILHLAASTMESLVEKTLEEFLAADAAFDYAQVKARCAPQTPAFPLIAIGLPDLAKRDLDLPRALRKLDLFELIILDDIGYVGQSPEEAEVLFTLMGAVSERLEWGRLARLVLAVLRVRLWCGVWADDSARLPACAGL